MVASIYKAMHCHTPSQMRSKNIFASVFMRYETTIIAPIMTLQEDISKVGLYNLGYICTLLELLF